jgi:hypothetical protein
MFIGVSLLTSPTRARKRDTPIRGDRGRLAIEQPHQARTGALSHLAVLLVAPSVHATELHAIHLTRELTREHQFLIL